MTTDGSVRFGLPQEFGGTVVDAFPKLEAAIMSAIEKYGAVFPKLNWTAPVVRFECWMLAGNQVWVAFLTMLASVTGCKMGHFHQV